MEAEIHEWVLLQVIRSASVLWSPLRRGGLWPPRPRAALLVDLGTGGGDFCIWRAVVVTVC